mgnify:CR=1 FL=1
MVLSQSFFFTNKIPARLLSLHLHVRRPCARSRARGSTAAVPDAAPLTAAQRAAVKAATQQRDAAEAAAQLPYKCRPLLGE